MPASVCGQCLFLSQSSRYIADSDALGELLPSPLDRRRLCTWSAKAPAHNTAFGREVAIALNFGLDNTETGVYPLPDHAALEFGEGARYLEEQLAGWRHRIEVQLVKVEIDTNSSQVLDCAGDQ